ncbi:DUF4142 domain-containing protein [Azospirillum isscasi]|uniref:DUF4142 domain-containing protein n=1 Tax=Azospirillum isscasi TaxID=3053926 RepID=A0ABU0WPF6_9PROT|nr:DUF4142 domain-containing protein [Azospirillum isscasi]MDQ2105727.1 DUF4142 domain-containing protein [Azospirillum isscasi]
MRRTFLAAVLLACLCSPAPAQSPESDPIPVLSRQERNFIAEALADGMAEQALGKLAQDRAETEPVRRFARRMADDHALMTDRLADMALRHGVPLPHDLSLAARAHMSSLRDTPDGAFDRRYMAAEEETHARAIKLYEAQAERGGATGDIARGALPTLHAHFEEARRIMAELARRPAPPQTQAPPGDAPPGTSGSSE